MHNRVKLLFIFYLLNNEENQDIIGLNKNKL